MNLHTMTSARAPGHFNMYQPTSETTNQFHHTKGELSAKAFALAQSKASARIKSRKRVNTAEKRASHNAVERQRRELLNTRFLVSLLSGRDCFWVQQC